MWICHSNAIHNAPDYRIWIDVADVTHFKPHFHLKLQRNIYLLRNVPRSDSFNLFVCSHRLGWNLFACSLGVPMCSIAPTIQREAIDHGRLHAAAAGRRRRIKNESNKADSARKRHNGNWGCAIYHFHFVNVIQIFMSVTKCNSFAAQCIPCTLHTLSSRHCLLGIL